MRVLFLHQNFPGQFVHVARALAEAGHEVIAITDRTNTRPDLVRTLRYAFDRRAAGRPHPWAISFAERVARGEAVAQAMRNLGAEGFVPDLVIGHFGWGETLFVRDVWPGTKLVVHAEYYYAADGADVGFDPEFAPASPEAAFRERCAVRSRNAAILLAMESADYGVAPTRWQGSRFPRALQGKIAILHEGIDTERVRPAKDPVTLRLPDGHTVRSGDEVVTFVNRNLEPYRGYHQFMRALPRILGERPNAHAVIVGGDSHSYGGAPPGKGSWKERFLDEVRDALPLDRVHFTGRLPYADFVALMQVSAAHVYLTYPFVLSWSLLEAMSAGAPVIASRTAPVEEVVAHGENGLLVDFFDHAELAETVVEVLVQPEATRRLRKAARQTIVTRYDLHRRCLPQWLKFVRTIVHALPDSARRQSII